MIYLGYIKYLQLHIFKDVMTMDKSFQ